MAQEQKILLKPDMDIRQVKYVLEYVYPVGSYIETKDANFDPNQSLVGSWIKTEILDDYIVEEGQDSHWMWRKWASGIAECWGTYNFTLTHYTTAFGGYGYNSGNIFFPFAFIEKPTVAYSASIDTDWALTGSLPTVQNNYTALYAVASGSGQRNTWWYVQVKGLWKAFSQPVKIYRWCRVPEVKIENVHGRWVDSGQRVDGNIVYKSSDSYHIANEYDAVKITFDGVSSFDLYIRSFAESNYDYVLVSALNSDYLITRSSTSSMRSAYSNANYTKAYTRGKQSATNYEKVTFDGLNPAQEYFIYVIYQKDSSTDRDDDCGYFYIG